MSINRVGGNISRTVRILSVANLDGTGKVDDGAAAALRPGDHVESITRVLLSDLDFVSAPRSLPIGIILAVDWTNEAAFNSGLC
jgi:hypothetical protein